MKSFSRWMFAGVTTVALAAAASAEESISPEQLAGSWQPHKVTINYFGLTSRYTCTGIEDHVKQILLHLGARKDLKVNASGCPYGPNSVSRNAWVDLNFYTLAPSDATQPDAVKVQWVARNLSPRRPFFMGDGDCELVQQMKDVIAKNFALKDLKYRTDCVPYQLNLNGYSVEAEALMALPVAGEKLAGNR